MLNSDFTYEDVVPAATPAQTKALARTAAENIQSRPLTPVPGDPNAAIDDGQGHSVSPGQPGYDFTYDQAVSPGIPSLGGHPNDALGFYQGLTKPLDNAAQGLEWLVNQGLKPFGGSTQAINQALGMPSAAQATANHQTYIGQQAQQGHTPGVLGDIAGNIVGTLPTMFEGPLVGGALAGAALTDSKDPLGILGSAGLGAAGGKVSDVVTRGVFDTLAPKLTSQVSDMLNRGVPLTTGQIQPHGLPGILERIAGITPVAAEFHRQANNEVLNGFNRAAYNEALTPVGGALPKDTALGPDALDYVRGVKNDAYKKVAELAPTVPLTDAYAARMQGLNDAAAQIQKPSLQSDYANFVNRNLAGRTDSASGGYMGEQLLKAIGDVRGKIQNMKTATSRDSFDNDYLNNVLMPLQDHLNETLGEANPAAAAQLAKAKQVNSGYMALKNTLAKTGDRQTTGEGLFVPQQLYMGSKQGASTDQKAFQNLWGQDLINNAKAVIPASGYSNINPLKDPHGIGEGIVTLGVGLGDLANHSMVPFTLGGVAGLSGLYHPAVQGALRQYFMKAAQARPGLLPALEAISQANSKLGATYGSQFASGLLSDAPTQPNPQTGLLAGVRP